MKSNHLIVWAIAATALGACGDSDEQRAGTASTSSRSDPDAVVVAASPPQRPAPEAAAGAESDRRFGPPLDRPERYYGVYANPQTPNRRWFVIEAKRPPEAEQAPEVPPGHLAIGAMFGDVAAWHMRTLSETGFEQAWVSDFQPEPVTVEFELDGDGRAVAMSFTDQQQAAEGRLERQGDLPEDWR